MRRLYAGYVTGIECSYGMGPTHGSVIQSIGLNKDRRDTHFSEEELNCMLYTLNNMSRIIDSLNKSNNTK